MASNEPAAPVKVPEPGMDVTAVPPWWINTPEEVRAFLESLDGVTVEEIGRTAGGRPGPSRGRPAR